MSALEYAIQGAGLVVAIALDDGVLTAVSGTSWPVRRRSDEYTGIPWSGIRWSAC